MWVLVFLLVCTAWGAPQQEIEEAKKSVMALIRPLMSGTKGSDSKGKDDFRVDGCDKYNIDWMKVLMMQAKPVLTYTFKEGCDIQGTIEPKLLQEFPAQFKLRNLKLFDSMETLNKVTSSIESRPLMTLTIQKGTLKSKLGEVKFDADYQVRLNPMNREAPVEENLGGVMRINQIYGLKVSIKEKLMVK